MPEKANKGLAKKIKRLRKEAHLSQAQLGNKLGVSYQQIQKYERGLSRLTVDSLLRLARALNVPVTELLEPEQQALVSGGSLLKEPEPDFGPLSKDEKELLKGFRELGDENLRTALLALTRAATGKKPARGARKNK